MKITFRKSKAGAIYCTLPNGEYGFPDKTWPDAEFPCLQNWDSEGWNLKEEEWECATSGEHRGHKFLRKIKRISPIFAKKEIIGGGAYDRSDFYIEEPVVEDNPTTGGLCYNNDEDGIYAILVQILIEQEMADKNLYLYKGKGGKWCRSIACDDNGQRVLRLNSGSTASITTIPVGNYTQSEWKSASSLQKIFSRYVNLREVGRNVRDSVKNRFSTGVPVLREMGGKFNYGIGFNSNATVICGKDGERLPVLFQEKSSGESSSKTDFVFEVKVGMYSITIEYIPEEKEWIYTIQQVSRIDGLDVYCKKVGDPDKDCLGGLLGKAIDALNEKADDLSYEDSICRYGKEQISTAYRLSVEGRILQRILKERKCTSE